MSRLSVLELLATIAHELASPQAYQGNDWFARKHELWAWERACVVWLNGTWSLHHVNFIDRCYLDAAEVRWGGW